MRRYEYIGPAEIRDAAKGATGGDPIAARADLVRWLVAHKAERDGATIPATFVVTGDGVLRLASRRSEHVACAGGEPVLAAGELFLSRAGAVIGASNLSTGFCPEPASWTALAAALDGAGIPHPGRYTDAFVFRRCPACGERNLVKDDLFACALCDAELPAEWNF